MKPYTWCQVVSTGVHLSFCTAAVWTVAAFHDWEAETCLLPDQHSLLSLLSYIQIDPLQIGNFLLLRRRNGVNLSRPIKLINLIILRFFTIVLTNFLSTWTLCTTKFLSPMTLLTMMMVCQIEEVRGSPLSRDWEFVSERLEAERWVAAVFWEAENITERQKARGWWLNVSKGKRRQQWETSRPSHTYCAQCLYGAVRWGEIIFIALLPSCEKWLADKWQMCV